MKVYYFTLQYWYKRNNFASKDQQTRYHVPSVSGNGKWRKEVHKTKPTTLEELEQRSNSLFKILHGFQHRAVANVSQPVLEV